MAYSAQGWVSKHIKIDARIHGIRDDVIKWKHFPLYWPFVRGTTRSFRAFFDLRLNKRLNKQYWDAGDLRRIYDVKAMISSSVNTFTEYYAHVWQHS